MELFDFTGCKNRHSKVIIDDLTRLEMAFNSLDKRFVNWSSHWYKSMIPFFNVSTFLFIPRF
jgi:hypothetical protein